MKVKLVSYSTPTEEFLNEGIDNAQELVAFCARVSNPSNQLNTETSEKLIKYLIKNAHWSPLEMVSACLEIETTRDIARQILRHRSFTFQVKTPPVSYLIKKAAKIKKGSQTTPMVKVGNISQSQVEEIAKVKMEDLNANDIESAKKIIEGTARSMGVDVSA